MDNVSTSRGRIHWPVRALFGVALQQQLRTKRILLTIAALAIPLLPTLYWAVSRGVTKHPQDVWGNIFILAFLHGAIPLAALLHAGTLMRAQVEEGTMTYLVTRPVPRWLIALTGYLGALAVVIVGVSVSATACFYLMGLRPEAAELRAQPGLLTAVLQTGAVASTVYASLFFLIGVILRRPVVVGFLFWAVWETFIGFIAANIRFMTAIHYLHSYFKNVAGDRMEVAPIFVVNASPQTVACPVIAGICVVCVVLSLVLFGRSEFRAETGAG